MNTAIIVAAGSGKRFGGNTPKQFLKIHGKPLIIYTIEQFERCESIDEIVLVFPGNKIKEVLGMSFEYKLKKLNAVVVGGRSRAESVFNGIDAASSDHIPDIVAIHDGARPLVSSDEISRTIKEAQISGAACLVGEVTDTIKEVAKNKIVGTIDRARLKRALTPQCFRYEIIKQAFDENEIEEIATDECFLVEKLGYEITLVEGRPENIKVTTPLDFEIAEMILSRERGKSV